ncbi:MAG: hypothetical protein ACFFEY_10580 [Candidatus Thorarchaeota archaeon]
MEKHRSDTEFREAAKNGNLNNINENLLLKNSYISCHFDKIPPIIGFLIADQHGNTLMVIEYNFKNLKEYRPIKTYISENEKNLLEIDLISMYFSSLKIFAAQTNIQNLSNLELHGSNIKVQIFYLFQKYMIIAFLNSKTELNLYIKTQIITYFEDMITKNEFEFKHYNASKSRTIINVLENKGRFWLNRLNKNYLHRYKNNYLEQHQFINEITREIKSVITDILFEYLENIQEEIVDNISREINNKIQDILYRFDPK